ncbi:NAD(+)/NADH kinase [Natrarchaeobaculum aegyptiacum]|uniref:NAD kinase n=1 Tax=Natrarchaeobaculum aegyptiacum TaxID=745377 RepID=A0A2Z2HR68_9EURY|nr:NAD(+)/NADH kinase [Natrarchaeobaculum aegyptiacum]ARS89522.1 NAD(+) kinase [Natrarchaeobaculum aegyptiacum]
MDVAVGIVAQRGNERAQRLAGTLLETLERDHGADVVVDEATASAAAADATDETDDLPGVAVEEMADRDLVVSIGGDGTLLFVARAIGSTPLVGVNLGEVGFLNAVDPADAEAVVTDLVTIIEAGDPVPGRDLVRLEASAAGESWILEPALNEVLVHGPRRGHSGGATIEIRVDGTQYVETHADGVLVATPTGSTAYNLSEGGPLVHPDADALVVTGMAPTEPIAPLVVDQDASLSITVSNAPEAFVIGDGRNRRAVEPPVTVAVSTADEPGKLVGPESNVFEALEKLE